jgi:hypothetical protein
MSGHPNFFLVGASKAGTTSLHRYLGQHPQIFMSPMKEPHFFADEVRKQNFAPQFQKRIAQWEVSFREYLAGPVSEPFTSGPVAHWQDYLKLFQGAGDALAVGESSPCYLWSATAPINIASRIPEARILMVLRDPAERAFAQHLHTLSVAESAMPFREHVDAALASPGKQIGELYPFLEFGFYGQQVARYIEVFGRDRIGVFFYEDYLRDAASLLRQMFQFLGVDDEFRPDFSERHMETRVPRWFAVKRALQGSGAGRLGARSAGPRLRRVVRRMLFRERTTMVPDPADRARLVEMYRSDILRLASLLERDLSGWLQP